MSLVKTIFCVFLGVGFASDLLPRTPASPRTLSSSTSKFLKRGGTQILDAKTLRAKRKRQNYMSDSSFLTGMKQKAGTENADVLLSTFKCLNALTTATSSSGGKLSDKFDCPTDSPIGKGKFAVVYKVTSKTGDTKKVLALKISLIGAGCPLEGLQKEFEILSKANSPHIVKGIDSAVIYDNKNQPLKYVTVMELAGEGEFYDAIFAETPQEVAARQRKTQNKAAAGDEYIPSYFSMSNVKGILYYFKQMVLAQMALRGTGYVSRDVKMNNMVLSKGVVKYIDLASAVPLGTKISSSAGTPQFMDPYSLDLAKVKPPKDETKKDETKKAEVKAELDKMQKGYVYDTHTDIYSLGMVLGYIVKGEEVFDEEDGWNEKSKYHQIIRAYDSGMIYIYEGTPIVFVYLLAGMLALKPENRMTLEEILYVIHAMGNDDKKTTDAVWYHAGKIVPTGLNKESIPIPAVIPNRADVEKEIHAYYGKDGEKAAGLLTADLIDSKAAGVEMTVTLDGSSGGTRTFELVEPNNIQFKKLPSLERGGKPLMDKEALYKIFPTRRRSLGETAELGNANSPDQERLGIQTGLLVAFSALLLALLLLALFGKARSVVEGVELQSMAAKVAEKVGDDFRVPIEEKTER